MGFFGIGKNKEKTVDLTQENKEQNKSESVSDYVSKGQSSGEYIDIKATDVRKRKLAKRLMDMTEKIEELSNHIYNLKQRVEFLERKNNIT